MVLSRAKLTALRMLAHVIGALDSGKNQIGAAHDHDLKQSARPPWYSGVVENVAAGQSDAGSRARTPTAPSWLWTIGLGSPEEVPEVCRRYAVSAPFSWLVGAVELGLVSREKCGTFSRDNVSSWTS